MKGQTLIEVLIALGLVTLIVSGIIVVITSSLSDAQFIKSHSLATQYAQEGMEVMRQIRDNNYNVFASYNGTYCLDKPPPISLGSAVSSCTTANVDNFFIRSVKIEAGICSPNVSRVTVTVSWNDSKCTSSSYCHNSQIISCLSTVDPIQGP